MKNESTNRNRTYLESLRTRLGYSQSDLAKAAGITITDYNHLESGEVKTIKKIVSLFMRISPVFSISIYDLMCLEADYQLYVKYDNTDLIDDDTPELHAAIKYQRIKSGYTLTSLAANIGVSKQFLSRIEKGQTIPNAKILELICKFLGLPDHFFDKNLAKSKLIRLEKKNEADNL